MWRIGPSRPTTNLLERGTFRNSNTAVHGSHYAVNRTDDLVRWGDSPKCGYVARNRTWMEAAFPTLTRQNCFLRVLCAKCVKWTQNGEVVCPTTFFFVARLNLVWGLVHTESSLVVLISIWFLLDFICSNQTLRLSETSCLKITIRKK
jgi:hypothetical protein